MTLLEQCNEQVIEDTLTEMGKALGLTLYYFGADDTYGFHSKQTGDVAFVNGHTYFPSLEALLKCLLTTGRIVVRESDSNKLIDNIFQGCTSLEEIRLKLAIYNGPGSL